MLFSGGMESMMKQKSIKKSALLLLMCFLLGTLLTGCFDATIDGDRFTTVCSRHKLQVIRQEDGRGEDNGATGWWSAAGKGTSCSIEYVEFDSEDHAKSFQNEEISYIRKTYGNGNTDGNDFSLNASSTCYRVMRRSNKVLIATCIQTDQETLAQILKDLPEFGNGGILVLR